MVKHLYQKYMAVQEMVNCGQTWFSSSTTNTCLKISPGSYQRLRQPGCMRMCACVCLFVYTCLRVPSHGVDHRDRRFPNVTEQHRTPPLNKLSWGRLPRTFNILPQRVVWTFGMYPSPGLRNYSVRFYLIYTSNSAPLSVASPSWFLIFSPKLKKKPRADILKWPFLSAFETRWTKLCQMPICLLRTHPWIDFVYGCLFKFVGRPDWQRPWEQIAETRIRVGSKLSWPDFCEMYAMFSHRWIQLLGRTAKKGQELLRWGFCDKVDPACLFVCLFVFLKL